MKSLGTKLGEQEGFTLIEILFAAGVVLLLVVGFLGAMTSMRYANEAAYQRTMALQDANQVIEQMRNTAATGTFPSNVTSAYPSGGTVSGFTSLTNETVTVSYASATANPLDVTVTVSYSENGRRTVTASLRTYMTQRS